MRVHLKTLGCRLNEAELETWSRDFQARGHRLTDDPAQADLLVVNTCAVTEEAVRKSRKLLGRSRRGNPHARLVVSGCHATLDAHATARISGVDLVVPNQHKARLVEIVERELALEAPPEAAGEQPLTGLLERGRQRAFIKVQDGCRYRCTFCIVTLARGAEHSRPIGEIVDEIERLHREGINEVVLTGVHLGGYGSDRGHSLSELIRRVLAQTGIPRMRIGSLEPWELPTDFWGLFEDPRFMPHLHLPLQSGADSVLRRMARRCRTAEYRRLVERARARVPELNLSTDIIVGFPGETEHEWRQTLAFVQAIGFAHVHIFAYSPRRGTKAALLPDPVSREIKRRRSEALHALAAKMKRETLQRQLGRTLPVLVEGDGASGWRGYTPTYLRVALDAPTDADLSNHIVDVHLTGLSPQGDALQGSLVGHKT